MACSRSLQEVSSRKDLNDLRAGVGSERSDAGPATTATGHALPVDEGLDG